MATITDNIDRIKQAKADIKEAIIAKGVEVADDVRIDGYADKISEIQQGGGGQFAIDYGEEIATNNEYSFNADKEDVDYYNQIQSERAAYAAGQGGRSDEEILADPEFKERIAWWPKGMACKDLNDFINLRCVNQDISGFPTNCIKLNRIEGTITASSLQYNGRYTPITFLSTNPEHKKEGATILNGPIVRTGYFGLEYMPLKRIHLELPNCTNVSSFPNGSAYIKEAYIDCPNVKGTVTNFLRGIEPLEKVYANIPNITTLSYSLGYNCYNVVEFKVKGLRCSLSPSSAKINKESLKFIFDNCQDMSAAGVTYTLTIHSTVKNNHLSWLSEDEEYAASYLDANEKGLTIA